MTRITNRRPVRSTGTSPQLSALSKKIANAVIQGVPGIVDKKLQPLMKKPAVSEAGHKVSVTYTLPNPGAAKAVVNGFGPMDDENLLTDNLNLPDGVDSIRARASGNKAIIEAQWKPQPGAKAKAIESALGMMSNVIIDTAGDVEVIEPQVKVSGDNTHGQMTLSYELRKNDTGALLDAASVQRIAGALKMDATNLQANHIALPAFVQGATATANGSDVVVTVSW
jgi:hypothetical protein